MKKLIICTLLLICSTGLTFAQEVWKERAEFFDVFEDIFLSAQLGDFRPIKERREELGKKFSPFYKSIMEKFATPKEQQMRRNAVVLSEKLALIRIMFERETYTNESLYGELVVIHNRYRKILLKDEEPHISKSLIKHYENQEDEYEKRKKKGLTERRATQTETKTVPAEGYLKKGFVRITGIGEGNLSIEVEANVWYVSKKEDTGVFGIKEWRKYIEKYEGIRFRYPTTSNKWFSFSGGETFGRCKFESNVKFEAPCVVIGGMSFKLNEPTSY